MTDVSAARPPYRMIAIDLDGTLLSPEGQVTPRCKAAIHSALAAGLLVCFATGRNWTESKMVLDAVAHYDTAVFIGGAMVMDTRQQVTLHRTMMQPALASEICGLLEDMGHAVLALQDKSSAGIDYLVTDQVPIDGATRQWMRGTKSTLRHVKSLRDYPHEHTIRVGIVAPRQEVDRVRDLLRERFGSRILCQSLRAHAHGVDVLEIFDPAVNKWQGLLHVARHHNVAPEQIIAIGDDVNDIPMIRGAGLGVAMGNALPEVQAVAGRVIKSNREDGLAEFLEELVATHQVAPEKGSS